MNFTHLHTHSHYSLLNGLTKIPDLVATTKKRGFTAATLVDNGAMYGAIEFYKACQKAEIKPIIGFDAYVAPRKMTDVDPEKDKEIYRLVLLAENYDGYVNLMKLCSKGQLHGLMNGVARIDKESMKEYSKNVIALSGNINGEVPQLLKQDKYEEAKKAALEYNEIFGQDNFYLEMQDHPAIEGQLSVNTKLIELSKDTGIPLVVSRDVYYLNPDDAEAQDILRCISNGWRVHETNREDFRHVDRSLNTGEDIASRFRHVPEALENTQKIADRINLEIELDVWHFAPVDIPKDKTEDDHLRDQTYECALKFYPEMTKEVTDRIDYELDIIKTKGYSPYFLCVADYVRYAKSNGIVESTRGSAAGSLVSYVLGITTVDPLRFQLPFERFLNPLRPSAPDVDTDFADDRRDDMIEYVTKKYGEHRVAQIITFGTMAARASVRDVGRALGLSYGFCDQVAKLIPPGAQGFPMTIERALKEEPDLKKLYDTNEDVKRLLDLGQKVEGCNRHTSIHAAGVVISPTDLTDYTPVQREVGGTRITTQYDMHAVEAAGVLKNDFLGIRNLSILGKAVEIVKKTLGEEVDIYNIPLEDKLTFEKLARGETMGVFQFASSGMTRWLKELKPTSIDDLNAMVALYRPGPMEFIPEYIRRKHNPEVIDYPHPSLEEILKVSLGLLIYQDDIMLTAIKLAGYDWLEADKFRKAMGKKIPELMVEQEKKFKEGCVNNNIPKEVVEDLWNRIKPFASYGFNKAHAASYGMVAYQTAYMKANYPVQYMTAILQAEFGDTEKVAAIVHECRRMDIEVLPPDINESFKNFAMVSKPGEKGRIRFGLTAVKNVGEHICEVIYRERKNNGSFKSLEDFLQRVKDKDLNKRSVEALAQVGAMDCLGIDRGVLLANIENILSFSKQIKERETSQQDSLFAGTSIALDSKVRLDDAPPASMDQKLIWEKKLIGLYVSSHPFVHYQEVLGHSLTPLADTENHTRDEWIVVGGVVDKVMKKITKKGDIMLFVTIEDVTGSVELLVFPKTYQTTQHLWQEGSLVCIVGKTPREEGEDKVYVENLHILNKDNVETIAQQVKLGFQTTKKNRRSGDYPEAQDSQEPQELAPNEEELNALEVRAPKPSEVVLYLSKQQLQQGANLLKDVLARYPGEQPLMIDVEGGRIKASSSVQWSELFEQEIQAVLGEVRIEK